MTNEISGSQVWSLAPAPRWTHFSLQTCQGQEQSFAKESGLSAFISQQKKKCNPSSNYVQETPFVQTPYW